MAIHFRATLVFAAAVAIGGCGPTTPSSASVAGTWGGTTNPPSLANTFSIRLTISQSGSALSGTWGTTFNNGTLTGDVNGASVSMTLTSPVFPSPCPSSTVTATVNGNQMSGTTHGIECPSTGRIELTRIGT
jgi:hypothetical protein